MTDGPATAACNCDASGDPVTGHRPWCGTEPDSPAGCYICRPDDPTASPEGCAACDARSDAYHAFFAVVFVKCPECGTTVAAMVGPDGFAEEVTGCARHN